MMNTSHDYFSPDSYVPRKQSKAGRPTKRRYLHRIAYTETMRGINDDVPTLLFYAPAALVKDACQYLYKLMQGSVEDITVVPSHSCRVKNGKCYWRTEVQVLGLDENLMSFDSFTLMLVHRIEVICNCKVRHLKLETFLNQ